MKVNFSKIQDCHKKYRKIFEQKIPKQKFTSNYSKALTHKHFLYKQVG